MGMTNGGEGWHGGGSSGQPLNNSYQEKELKELLQGAGYVVKKISREGDRVIIAVADQKKADHPSVRLPSGDPDTPM